MSRQSTRFTQLHDGRLQLEGDLTWAHIGPLSRGLLTLAGREGDLTLDLAGVQHCDSATVAMLVACKRIKQRQHDHLLLVDIPERLSMLFAVYGLEKAFGKR